MTESTLQGQYVYSSLGDDPDLGELVELFVSEMPVRITTLQSQFEQSDWEELRRTAHQLKGAAGSYGFEQVTPYAARLETACRESKGDEEIRKAYDGLVGICGRTRAGVPE